MAHGHEPAPTWDQTADPNLNSNKTIRIATRGSALALAQANMVLAQCRDACPQLNFELRVIKTTGDKLQTASLAREGTSLPKGLFTKELEVALLKHDADLAVHSLKDLPTELPTGLKLGAVGKREDVRDVLIFRDADFPTKGTTPGRGFRAGLKVADLPAGAVVATSSTRRKAQLAVQNPSLSLPDIRGNVVTRMEKLLKKGELDATVLALAGMTRLKIRVTPDGHLIGEGLPEGLLASILDLDTMLPCVGQGAIGIEVREQDEVIASVCEHLNHSHTHHCVVAERAFLAAMGGGCQSPVAAYAEVAGQKLRMRAVSFAAGPMRRTSGERDIQEAEVLGAELAARLKA
jgi:hydroxymethylbilane synthase